MTNLANDLNQLGDASRNFFDRADLHMLINGEFVPSASGETLNAVDPSSGDVVATVPAGDVEDVDRAVKAARAALESGPWARFKPVERERCLLKLAELIEQHGQELAEIETVNSGRALAMTQFIDVGLSVDCLRYMAGWATKIEGRTMSPSVPLMPESSFHCYSNREPIGVVAAITPWNVALNLAIWKLAPALAAGCTVVLKPAELTPLSALRFGELILEAGIPPGVVNIVTGLGPVAGEALANHPGIDKISFTGSTAVGRHLGEIGARHMKKVTLELGGKSPVIVFEDADLEKVIPGAIGAIYANNGQFCSAGSRLYVHEKLYEKVVSGVAEIASSMQLGPGLDPDAQLGPLVSSRQQDRVLGYIESGKSEGAELVVGGGRPDHPGCYVEPTVFANTNESMTLVQEEIFGPVLTVMPFKDEEEVISRANATQYGLAASIWSTNVNRVHRVARKIDSGNVWINAHGLIDMAVPYGGMKQSGMGHDLGEEAVLNNTKLKVHMMPFE